MATTTPPVKQAGAAAAPGKRHRKPPPTVHGAKHSDLSIAKARAADELKRRARD